MEGNKDDWTIPQDVGYCVMQIADVDFVSIDINAQVINTYCYIMSTFTLPRALAGDVGRDVAAPGVGAYDSRNDAYTVKVSRYLHRNLVNISTIYLQCHSVRLSSVRGL